MNPLLFKAHPLLELTVALVMNPRGHSLGEFWLLVSIYLIVNLAWAGLLMKAVRWNAGFAPPYWHAYFLALPSLIFYLPLMLTLLSDVLAHDFHFSQRYILIFTFLIALHMLGAAYGVLIGHPRHRRVIGLHLGLMVALTLLLLSLPLGLLMLGLNAWLTIL